LLTSASTQIMNGSANRGMRSTVQKPEHFIESVAAGHGESKKVKSCRALARPCGVTWSWRRIGFIA
jgi:hypothetical protein